MLREPQQNDKEQWEKFQELMQFCDELRHHISFCRITTQKERDRSSENNIYQPLTLKDVEKMVRRYLNLPPEEQVLTEIDKMIDDIRKKHKEDDARNALPGVPQ